MDLIQHMIKMELIKNKLTIILIFIFQLLSSQTPTVSKKYNFDNFINAFIDINNDNNFKPNLSIIHISSFYYDQKGYLITITRDNIESIMVNPKAANLKYFKYRGFDLLLQGKTCEDVTFLEKIIKERSPSNFSNIKFKKPYENISYTPYQWFLFFDKKMNLMVSTFPEEEDIIRKVLEKYNIKMPKE